jgi:hypothetical protein
MAGQDLSNYLENKLIEHVLRHVSYTSPSTVYLALFTANPGEAGDQTNEVSAGEYARQSITFGAAADGICLNTLDVTFPVAASDWGTITHLAILDAATAGNMLFYGAASGTPIHITSTNIYKVLAGNLSAGLA